MDKVIVTIAKEIMNKEEQLICILLDWQRIKYTIEIDFVKLLEMNKGKPIPTVDFYDDTIGRCRGFDEVYNYITYKKGLRLC